MVLGGGRSFNLSNVMTESHLTKKLKPLVPNNTIYWKGWRLSSVLHSLGELPGVPAEPGHLVAAVPGVSYWRGRRSCLSPAGVSLTRLSASWRCPTGSPPHCPWSG